MEKDWFLEQLDTQHLWALGFEIFISFSTSNPGELFILSFLKCLFICLPGVLVEACGISNLHCIVTGSLVVVCGFLVAACGIWFPD